MKLEEVTQTTTEPSPEKSWYVVNAYSGHEKKVAQAIEERIELSEFKSHFGEVVVPSEEVVEMRGGQKRRSERKFFPGYIFVQMAMNEHTWQIVKATPRVIGFIGGTINNPVPISDEEAQLILDRVREGNDNGYAQDAVWGWGACTRN